MGEAVQSVLSQMTDELRGRVEVCISDNASADGTKELVEGYSRAYGDFLVYHRSEVNKQFIGNMIHLVEMARGKYCWFLGSDDQLAGGAGIAKVLQILEQHPDTAGVSVNWADFYKWVDTETGSEREGEPTDWSNDYLLPENCDRTHVYTSADEILLHCGIPHTYISSNIVAKKLWMDVVEEEGVEKIANYFYYPHTYIMGLMSKKHPKWVWCPDKLIKHRTGNDAMVEFLNGEYHTQTMAVMDDTSNVWSALLGRKSPIYKNLMYKQSLWAWTPRSIRWIKSHPNYDSLGADLVMLRKFTKHLHFVPGFWFKTFPILLTPHILMPDKNIILRTFRRTKNSFLYRSGIVWEIGTSYLKKREGSR